MQMADVDVPDRAWDRGAIVKTALTIAFIVAGAVFVARHISEFKDLTWPSAIAVGTVVTGFVANVFFRSLYNYIACRGLGADLSLRESFMLSAVVTASNVILPANPGAAFRAMYMKRVHAFPYAYFASSTLLYFIITAMMMSVFAICLLLLIQIKLDYSRPDLLAALPVIVIVAGIGLLLRQAPEVGGSPSVWSSFKNSYLDLVKDHRLVIASLLIVTLNFLVASVVWVVALRDYAPDIALLEAFLFAASQIASGLISLTPGAAGFQEIVGVYVGRSFAITTVELFAVLVWVRLVRTASAIALGIPCAAVLRTTAR
jgi:uncharacterized membrane protein YbhN (UPF0104 family)